MYREDKTTQMAASFLKLAGGPIPYLKLLKLLYLADKQMLVQYGFPITYDRWVSMKYGPVLSNTYNLMKPTALPGYWRNHIQTQGYDSVLSEDPGTGDLSVAEDRIIEEVFERYRHYDKYQLVAAVHELPEWEDPGNSSKDIPFAEVLRFEGLTQEDIDAILENIQMQDEIDREWVSA